MEILNYVNGQWIKPETGEYADVINPATGECLARTPLCGPDEVAAAAEAAAAAFLAWRQTPVQERIQPLFKIRDLLRSSLDDIARTITNEAGKTLDESRAEMV
ncbi:MAG TPA: aldehyde dehydrogenase family protein, partial [Anaerolineales bacterium]